MISLTGNKVMMFHLIGNHELSCPKCTYQNKGGDSCSFFCSEQTITWRDPGVPWPHTQRETRMCLEESRLRTIELIWASVKEDLGIFIYLCVFICAKYICITHIYICICHICVMMQNVHKNNLYFKYTCDIYILKSHKTAIIPTLCDKLTFSDVLYFFKMQNVTY